MKKEVKKKFDEFDPDESGSMDSTEVGALVESILGYAMDEESLDKAVKEMDEDGGGHISWDEFEAWFFKEEKKEEAEKEEKGPAIKLNQGKKSAKKKEDEEDDYPKWSKGGLLC
jgi:Ca2+-binding EF-hand superfamily protein